MTGTDNTQQEGFKVRAGAALGAFMSDCSGTSAIEYAVVATALGAAVLAGVAALADGVESLYGRFAGLFS